MPKYTVIYTHNSPIQDAIAHHLSYKENDTPEAAARECKAALGNYATILVVLEGHVKPLITHDSVWTDEKIETAFETVKEPTIYTVVRSEQKK